MMTGWWKALCRVTVRLEMSDGGGTGQELVGLEAEGGGTRSASLTNGVPRPVSDRKGRSSWQMRIGQVKGFKPLDWSLIASQFLFSPAASKSTP